MPVINDVNSDLQAAMVVPAEEYKSIVNYRQRSSQAIFVARGPLQFVIGRLIFLN